VGPSAFLSLGVFLTGCGGGLKPAARGDLLPSEFQPRPMLHAPAHEIARAKFPAVDMHQHLLLSDENDAVPADELVAMMDKLNIRAMVHLTGGFGPDLSKAVAQFSGRFPDRFLVFAQFDYSQVDHPDFSARMVTLLRDAKARGARGLKILKDLGLGVRKKDGSLLTVDDPVLDAAWNVCGELGLPVAIHTSDPEAFFQPVDRHNERWDELGQHPEWSFLGKDYPTKEALLAARDRVFARHPKTQFIALHVGNWPENLDAVSEMLDRHPNVVVEIGARHAELGRQPRRARKFIMDYSDRVLFGTDIAPTRSNDLSVPVYQNYFRFLETADEYFPYAYGGQGRWNIYGLELPDDVLEKVYSGNAARVLGLSK